MTIIQFYFFMIVSLVTEKYNGFIEMLVNYFIVGKGLEFALNFLRSISPTLAALAAISNLVLVITFFRINKKDTEKQRVLTRKSYWYREVILNKNLKILDENFEKIHDTLDSLKTENVSEELIKATIQNFLILKREILNTINNLIRIMDSDFASELDDLLDDLEDQFTVVLADFLSLNKEDFELEKNSLNSFIIENKNLYLKMLYTYEQNEYNLN